MGATCRGCYAFGSSCGKCSRCFKEQDELVKEGKIEDGSRGEMHLRARAFYERRDEKKKKIEAIQEVFTGYGSDELRKAEDTFNEQALALFSRYKMYEHAELLFPQVLVRILPKDLITAGGIYIPDVKASNKPTYEGIVIATWMPKDLPTKWGSIHLESEVKFGDHVIFPHFAGMPLPGMNEDLYRVIPEGVAKNGARWLGNDAGVIFCKLDYKRPSVEEVFKDLWSKYTEKNDYLDHRELLSLIREKFDIVVKVKGSKTLSGV
jgi:co-chaperonin GroES (HSP10)